MIRILAVIAALVLGYAGVSRRFERSIVTAPILFVTARDDEVERVLGLELGADDYVTKPFSVRELLLRLKAVLREINGWDADGNPLSTQDDAAAALVAGNTWQPPTVGGAESAGRAAAAENDDASASLKHPKFYMGQQKII